MSTKYPAPRGTFDILPHDNYKWELMKETFKKTAKLFNYKRITTPIFESSDLFERSSGDTSDIVSKEMYVFYDKKKRKLALRPEGTAPVIRSYIENHLELMSNPSRLYYLGPMFRYDRPQAGRYRQFYQYGIENIGSGDPFSDFETIVFGHTFLRKMELSDFSLEINSIGCSNCSKEFDKALMFHFNQHLSKLCNDCRERLKKQPKRVLDCKNLQCKVITEKAPSILDFLDSDCEEHFNLVKNYLDTAQISYTVNDRIVRGLDYYTHTAFEFTNNLLGAQSTLIGGGRYNKLIKQLGGKETPAVGLAGGFERLLISIEKENIAIEDNSSPQLYFINLSSETSYKAIQIVHNLRLNDYSVAFDNSLKSLKAQLKTADKLKIKHVFIFGENELNNNTVTFKNMISGEQSDIKLENIVKELKIMKRK